MDFDVKRIVNDNQQVSYTFRTFKSAEVRTGDPVEIVDKKETMTMGQLLDQKNNLMNLLSQLQERIDAANAAEIVATQPAVQPAAPEIQPAAPESQPAVDGQPAAGQPSTDSQPAAPTGT